MVTTTAATRSSRKRGGFPARGNSRSGPRRHATPARALADTRLRSMLRRHASTQGRHYIGRIRGAKLLNRRHACGGRVGHGNNVPQGAHGSAGVVLIWMARAVARFDLMNPPVDALWSRGLAARDARARSARFLSLFGGPLPSVFFKGAISGPLPGK